jgi:hypothetical protein
MTNSSSNHNGGAMDGENDLHEQILQVEADLDELTDVVDRCRKIVLISKATIAAGVTLILAIALGGIGFDPAVLIGSIAAVIGGTVVFGSNTSTLKQTASAIETAEAHRAGLISRLDLRAVGERDPESAANVLGQGPSLHRSRPRLQNGPWNAS